MTVHKHPDIVAQGTVTKQSPAHAVISPTNTDCVLSELAAEWHFFNHGALFTYTALQEDPVGEWYCTRPRGTHVMRQPYKVPIFSGLNKQIAGAVTWDHVICGVHKEDWQSLFEFLGGVAVMDETSFCQVFSRDVTVRDPGFVDLHNVVHPGMPTISVTLFCINGDKAQWDIQPYRTIGALDRPTFVRQPPQSEIISLAKAVRGGDIEQLQHAKNPAFQHLLDKYRALTGGSPF